MDSATPRGRVAAASTWSSATMRRLRPAARSGECVSLMSPETDTVGGVWAGSAGSQVKLCIYRIKQPYCRTNIAMRWL